MSKICRGEHCSNFNFLQFLHFHASIGNKINDSDFSLLIIIIFEKFILLFIDKSVMAAAVPLVSNSEATLLEDEHAAILLLTAKRNHW